LTPIEKMDTGIAGGEMTFFPPHAATTYHVRQRRWSGGQKFFTAKNPPYGAILNYYLKEAAPPDPAKSDKEDKLAAAKTDKEEKGKPSGAEEKGKTAVEA